LKTENPETLFPYLTDGEKLAGKMQNKMWLTVILPALLALTSCFDRGSLCWSVLEDSNECRALE